MATSRPTLSLGLARGVSAPGALRFIRPPEQGDHAKHDSRQSLLLLRTAQSKVTSLLAPCVRWTLSPAPSRGHGLPLSSLQGSVGGFLIRVIKLRFTSLLPHWEDPTGEHDGPGFEGAPAPLPCLPTYFCQSVALGCSSPLPPRSRSTDSYPLTGIPAPIF